MSIMKYNDTCEIFRPTGTVDQWDNPVVETVYSGSCLYQEKTSVSYPSGVTTRTPLIFLPDNDTVIQIDDAVEVTTEKGRTMKATVKLVRDVNMTGLQCTRIELKQGQGD